MRIGAVVIAVVMVWTAAASAPRAQDIHLDMRRAPLIEALEALRAQTGIDVVYARRLTEGVHVRCRYTGDHVDEALQCLLRGTGLYADRVRRKQYVLIAGTAAEADSARGALTGFVTDAETGERLPGAHVYLPVLRLGAVTNEAGYFALPGLPEGRYGVRVSFVGYQAKDTTLTPLVENQHLAPAPATLEAGRVTVTAAPPGGASAGVQPGLEALPASRLRRLPSFLGEQDLFRSLQQLPGVYRTSDIYGGLSVRGGHADQNLYLLDGAPVYHPWHAFSLISTFQTETFSNVRFYRGAFPAEHGGRLSSVIEAQMKDGSRHVPRAQLALSPLSGRFVVEAPVARGVSFMLGGRRSYLDKLLGREHPVEDARGRRDTLRTGYYFYDVSAKLAARLDERHRLTLSYYRGRDDLDLRLPFDLSLDVSSWLRPADLFFEIDQGWENRVYSLRHRFLVSDQVFLTTTGYRSEYRAREGAFVRPTGSAFVTSDYGVRLLDHGLKVDVDYYYSLAHQLRMGVHVAQQRYRSTLDAAVVRAPGVASRQAEASGQETLKLVGYVQDTWKPTARWTIQPGLRASLLSSGRRAWLRPRLSVQYAVHPRYLTLRGAAALHVQHVQRLRDRYSLAYDLVSSRWIPAGAAVEPATGAQLSLEAESRPAPGLTFRLGAYARRAKHVLVPEDVQRRKDALEGPGIGVGALLGQYVPARTRGVGLEAEAHLEHGPWRASLGYTASRSLTHVPVQDDGAQGEAAFRPGAFDLPHALRATATYGGSRWTAALALVLRSGYPLTVPEARYAVQDPLDEEPTRYFSRPHVNNGRLPTYMRVDASLGRRFEWLGARWHGQLHVYNALNRRNVIGRRHVPGAALEGGTLQVDNRRSFPILPLFELSVIL